jgi:hypothetical protein
MAESEDQPFSELQLGIRELFRIVIPGAYGLVLLTLLPGASLPDDLSSSTVRLAVGAFFLGLLGYALRAHESWWPYSPIFWNGVNLLNAAIEREVGRGEHTALYKYFLSRGRRDVGHRVHYFSSFYYLLVAISLYSAFAACYVSFLPALRIAHAKHLTFGYVGAVALLAVAAIVQCILMIRGRGPIPDVFERFACRLPAIFVGLALMVMGMHFAVSTRTTYFSAKQAAWVVALFAVAALFGKLAARQWNSIIREQVVHVHVDRKDLANLV